MRKTLTMLATAGLALSVPLAVMAGPRQAIRDRVEDRLDRLENRIDERVDHGRLDVIEDHLDRWEDRRDRAGLPVPPALNRWERQSWKRIWCVRHDNEPEVCTPNGDAGE